MRAEHMELKLLSLWTMIPEKDLINIIECANNCEPIDQDKLDKISRELNVSKDFLLGKTDKIEPLVKPDQEEVDKIFYESWQRQSEMMVTEIDNILKRNKVNKKELSFSHFNIIF